MSLSHHVLPTLSVCCTNVQSLNNKALSVAHVVVTQGIDILALTETWLGTDSDSVVISESAPSSYDFLHISRN